MNIVILGPPGSGKGTQARLLSEALNLFYFESGRFSRELAKENSRIRKIIKKGELIPEKEMTSYVSEYIEKMAPDAQNIIFDGYPRFVTQFKFLVRWLKERKSRIDKVFLLRVSEKEVVRRLSARRRDDETGKIYNLITNPPPKSVPKARLIQREDDKPKVIKERLKEYSRNTLPMIDYVKRESILEVIDGERPIDVIHRDIISRVS
jgi:adenylate kinase